MSTHSGGGLIHKVENFLDQARHPNRRQMRSGYLGMQPGGGMYPGVSPEEVYSGGGYGGYSGGPSPYMEEYHGGQSLGRYPGMYHGGMQQGMYQGGHGVPYGGQGYSHHQFGNMGNMRYGDPFGGGGMSGLDPYSQMSPYGFEQGQGHMHNHPFGYSNGYDYGGGQGQSYPYGNYGRCGSRRRQRRGLFGNNHQHHNYGHGDNYETMQGLGYY